MVQFFNTPLGRFRLTALAEGVSYLFLLLVAMPVKYLAGEPRVVLYTGWVHGLLFMLYILTLIAVKMTHNWGTKKTALAFIASLIPFGTFVLDKSLRQEHVQEEKAS